jgi:PAS domain S-box-containing protein
MTPLSRPRSLRFHLGALVLASTVPLLIFAIVLTTLLDGPGRTSVWVLVAGGVAALAIAAVCAVVIGGRITRGVATLLPSPTSEGARGGAALAGASRIAEVERAERERADTAASFRLMFENNPLPMWVYDLQTLAFLEVNVAAVTQYGYSRAEFLVMRLPDIRPPEEVARLEKVVAGIETGATATGRRHDATWKHRRKDGSLREVEIVSHAIDFAGRRAALVVVIDVTELKQAEATRTTYAERLRVLHEIDAAIIAAQAPVAIAEAALGPLRDLLGVPRAIVNLFDLETGEAEWLAAIGRRRLRTGPGVRFPLTMMGDVEALTRGELQIVDTTRLPPHPAVDALLASGVHLYMVVPMIAAGELIGAVSFGGAPGEFSEDQINIAREVAAQLAIALAQARLHERITRQAAELEQRVRERTLELTAANDEADRANQAKSDFLSRMSHELRTPLNAILGFGQLLEMRAEDARDRESVEQILKGGRHLLSLINEVLDISRIEAGRLSLSPEPVLVGEAIKRVVDLARPLAGERRIELHADSSAFAERYVLADSQRLQQVLLNLVSNGIKYNREGGRVTLACHALEGDRLRVTVVDTGLGISPTLRARLFTPFDRLGVETHGVEGTGLGLALSKRLVEAMGGTIGLESVEGHGTTFWVELPETESPDQRSGLGPPQGAPIEAGARVGTILYIEDNPSNLRLVERVLGEHTAIRLIAAMQGRLGLELAHEHRPDLILADLHLPDMSGEDVLREIQADHALKDIPVVVVSADATPGRIKRLLASGARAYLTKPINVQELLTAIEAWMPTRPSTG